jgi:hypothetical protein
MRSLRCLGSYEVRIYYLFVLSENIIYYLPHIQGDSQKTEFACVNRGQVNARVYYSKVEINK